MTWRTPPSVRSAAALLAALGACTILWSACGQTGPFFHWTNFAGNVGNYGSQDGTGSAAQFYEPYGAAIDHEGTIYIADTHNCTIRKLTVVGEVTTLAGMANTYGSEDGIGETARFNNPAGIAVDTSRNLYVADFGNHTIRKITPDGAVTTLAGLAGNPGSANGTGSAARFNQPYSVAVTSSGLIFVADRINHTIRKVTQAGEVTTFAGLAGYPGSANGTGSAARFFWPSGVAVDPDGSVFVADWGNATIRRITPWAVVSTLAGLATYRGSSDGKGSTARFNEPWGLAADRNGNLFVADNKNNTIRHVTPDGVVTTVGSVAGEIGQTDGFGSAARFWFPTGLAVNNAGFLYLADTYNNRISKGTPIYASINLVRHAEELQLSWSDKFLGWELQAQTNLSGTGLGTIWSPVSGSTVKTNTVFSMDTNNGTVFFRLYSPQAP